MIILEKPTTRRQQEFLAAVKRSKRFHGSWVTAPQTSAAFKLIYNEPEAKLT
jgi:hypothetical protein